MEKTNSDQSAPVTRASCRHVLSCRFNAIWGDQLGAVVSTELILVAVVAVIGLVVGLTSVRDAMVSELADFGGSIQELNQSYSYSGVSYIRDQDGVVTVTFDDPPTNEGEFVPLDPPVTIDHTVGGIGTLTFGNVNTGSGGSVTGTLTASDGTTTGYISTTDTGEIRNPFNGSIGFRESPAGNGTFTTTFDDPIADLEFFVAGLYGGANQNVLGNFTVTLSDGTVLSNAAFAVLPDAIGPSQSVGAFTTQATDTQLVASVNIGGTDYLQDPTTNDGTLNQAAGRIVFTDVPPPGDQCIGIVSVSFERQGGPPNFTAYYSFSGSVITIAP